MCEIQRQSTRLACMKPEILSPEEIKRIQLSSENHFPSCPVVCSSFIICEQIMLAPLDLQGYFEIMPPHFKNRSSSNGLCLLLSCESFIQLCFKVQDCFCKFLSFLFQDAKKARDSMILFYISQTSDSFCSSGTTKSSFTFLFCILLFI